MKSFQATNIETGSVLKRLAPVDLPTSSGEILEVTAMRRRIFTAVAIVACFALVATVLLSVWFGLQKGIGGGTNSVGDTSVQYVSINRDGRISLLIWSDAARDAETRAESALFGSSKVEGFFSAADGKRIDWQWEVPKERGGEFRLNGTPYDPANGTLFLVSTQDGQVRVTQLDVDLSKIQPDKQGFEAFAKNEPRVAQFIADVAGRK